MKSVRIFQYIILGISLLFVATTCQREEEVTLAELFVRNQCIAPQYTTAQLSCAFECNGTFKQAMVYYSTDITFEEYQSQDMTKQKDGSWLVELENLLNDTTYYVRYEVLNSYSNLVAEQIDTFATRPYEVPQLSPTIVLDTTSNSASIAGKIISNGGLPITERGVCYGLSSTPILEDSLYIVCTQEVDSFVCELKDLSVVTTYYARAYAKNEKGIAYGEEVSFTTLSTIPSVGAIATTDIALTSVTIAGEILSDGGATLTECGICYSMLGTPTIDNDKVMSSANVGSFNCQLDNLKMGTTYYARLYATNANGTVYSNPIEFTTLTTTAEIITTEATNITAVSAIIGGDIVSDGGEAVTVRGVCYADKPNPTIADSKIESGEGIGTFSCMLDDLHPGTIYYARAYAVNKQGTAYGNEISFTTLCVLAEVTTAVPTAIGLTDATVGGEVVSDGGAEITERGVCFATSENPTLDNSEKQICGAGIGNFTTKLSDLQRGTTYYVRAYAINSEGIAYGEQQSFMTSSTKASVVTAIPSNIGLTEATVGGEVIDDGGASVSERGICYSHAANPTIANNKIQKGAGIGVFTHKLTNLTMGATYHVRAYATNVNGTVYGESISFTMGTTTPTVSTSSITNITPTSATIEGNVIADGGSAIIERGICYSNTNQKPTTNDLKIAQGTGIGVFTCELTDLALGTTYYVCAYATNGNGTQYGEVKSFTTGTLLPTLESTPADNITAIGATVGGNITSDGGAEITARGVCYSTKENPTVDDTKVSSGTGVGEFSCNLTGLTFNTTYYVRAYATNSKGTAYGNQITFKTLTTTPTVVTNAASNITATSATVGGNATSDGGSAITARGICYSTSANPTIEGDKVASGSGIGEFECNITGLAFNTKYYARAYATNANGTVYGEEVTFTTLASMGTLTTSAASNITVTSATVGGNITSDGGAEITARGVCYSTKENPTVDDTKVSSGTGTGAFSCNLTGLTFNTTYYVRAYATNSRGTAYGNQITFKTLTTTPTVVTSEASNITATSATVGGNITSDGGSAITARGICYSTKATPTIDDQKVTSTGTTGTYSCTLEDLAFNTKYYARAYATNANGTVYGEEVTFTTLTSMGTLTTSAASNITVTSATVGGNITSDGGAEITARGVCYSTKENPTVDDTKVSSGTGTGAFSCNLTGLTFNTTYYVRAYATNSKGTAYGNQITFKTLTTTPTVVTNAASNITATSATVGGNITSDGGATITARGICYSTKPTPTISDNKVDKSGTIGTYSCTLEGLSVATTYYARAYATNANGTVYGEEVTFTTLTSMGTLTTSAASNITVTSATVGGNITSDGGAEIIARGVCYSTKENPTVDDTKVASGSGVGEFSCNLTGLTFNTTYYVRAYATNSKGTAYGNQITFKTLTTTPTVVTSEASNITATSATVGGNITSDGGSAITARGICYSTKATPTIDDQKVTSTGTTGTYSCTLEDLAFNTKYYARAYATNANGTVYGEEVTFTTLTSMGTLTTSAASNITVTSATVGGNITSDGGAEITARGVCYSTKENPTVEDTKVASGSGVGEFSCNLTGLTFNTTYYVRAYATNSKGTAYGNQITFKTLTTTPTVVTNAASNITATSATIGGNVTNDGGATITARGICYSTKPTPTISDKKVASTGTTGIYSCTLEGLSVATTYYARAYATNANGTVYGEEVTFTTLTSMGTLTTSAASNITVTSATVGGNITSDGGAEITARGVCYSTKENPTVDDTKVSSGTGTGAFSCNLTGLTFNTTYYVRAYATNSKGTAYGNQITFKTLTTTPTVVTSEASNITATSATVGGNITSDGGATITARGICYSTKTTPTIDDQKVTSTGTTGTYSCALEDLAFNTKYYARAYATNANGTVYGEEVTFTTLASMGTLTTSAASNITVTSATVGGNITSDGGAEITARGVCYSTKENPTVDDTKVSSGTGVGEFSCNLTGLTFNTTYYVRAYATNSKGTAYGNQITFKTLTTTPTVVTNAASNITATSATVGGNVTNDGGSEIIARGICYGTKENPTISDKKVDNSGTTGTYSCTLEGLSAGTTYYARAYATNANGTVYGEQITFATIAGKPNVVTLAATDVTGTTATLGGNVISSGGADVLKRGICYATTANPTTANNNVTCGSGVGEFSCSVMDLTPNTTYYVRAYATNNKGTAYAEQISFTTQCTAPTMGATTVSVVGINSATIEGSITSNGGSTITERGICYNMTGEPTIADDAIIVESTSNSFTGKLTNLQENTTYYARAYAINDIGVAYGEQVAFTTLAMYVDLGLPSGIMWATCNVGADSPEDYGDYFAWGEVESKEESGGWSDYKHCNGDYNLLTKYNTSSEYGLVDNKTTLELSDDAAYMNWGGVWRMPTNAEMTELRNHCTWIWTTQNGVKGMKVTSNSNGNSIFLPAAGSSADGDRIVDVGVIGEYWSSSLYTDAPDNAWQMSFSSWGVTKGAESYYSRVTIQSVRPVLGENKTETVPTITTTLPSQITTTTAVVGGNVTSDGGASVTECGVCYSTSANPTISNKKVTAGSGTGSFTCNLNGLQENTTYYVRAYAVNSKGTAYGEEVSFTNSTNGHEYVDLGLSVMWATCNVGADSPEDYGDYFAWGETSTKSTYDWSTYKWCNGSYNTLTKYVTDSKYGTVDNKTQLELSDDAAHVNWGGVWRMPTYDEWKELEEKCTCILTTVNGIKGYKVTSNVNNNSIFFPVAGAYGGSSLHYAGGGGFYWSSSLWAVDPRIANYLSIFAKNYEFTNERNYGQSVRPVCQ